MSDPAPSQTAPATSGTTTPAVPEVFPESFAVFAAAIKNTSDEIWTLYMKQKHGMEKNTPDAWQSKLSDIKTGN